MKFIFIILIAFIFYAKGHSRLSVVYNREKIALDVYVYSPLKDSIDVRLYDASDNMVDEMPRGYIDTHYEPSFDFRNRTNGIYTVIVDIGNKMSLKKLISVKK